MRSAGRPRRFSDKEEKEICLEYSRGCLVNDIIKKYKCSSGTLYSALERNNIKISNVQTWKDREVELLKKMCIAGCSCFEMSYALGRSVSSVKSKMSSLNICINLPRSVEDRVVDILKMREAV